MSSKSLIFLLFGAPQLLRDGVSLHGKASQRRRIALLALLACAPSRTLSRDRLIGLLWPERDNTQARKLLSESLYVIRRELGDELIDSSNGDMLTLNAGLIDCDAWQFSVALQTGDLETAARLSDSPFMDGIFLDEAEDFGHWLDGERSRIARERETALQQLAVDAEREERWLDAARARQRMLHDDPLSSRHVLGAAEALAKGGEVPGALQLLAAFEDRLRRELDVSPEPAVLQLAQRLRADRPAGPSGIRPTTPADGTSRTPTPSRGADSIPNRETPPAVDLPVPRLRWRGGLWLGAAALVAVVVAIMAMGSSGPAESPYDTRRLAVLYFRDGSAEGDLASVADLITESVIEQLAGSPAFEVVPVSGVRLFRDGAVGVDSIARRFRAGSVIDGAVHRRGENLVVRVQLIDSESGAVLSSSLLERGLHELFALEVDVAREVAISIRQRLGQDVRLTQLQRESSNVRAWQLVARGNREREAAARFTGRRGAEDSAAAERGLSRADSLYRQAHIEDPNWVRPAVERGWVALQASHWLDGSARVSLLERALARVDSIQERQQTHPSVLEVRSALRWARLKTLTPPIALAEITAVVEDLESAVSTEPDRARAWATLSNIYWMRGEVERGESAAREALRADAYIEDGPAIYRSLFATSLYRFPIDSAAAWCDRGRREYPDVWWFHECQLTIMKYDRSSPPNPNRAWAIVQQVDSLDPPERAAAGGHAYAPVYRRLVAAAVSARAGDSIRARSELATQRAMAARDSSLALDMIPDEITLLLLFGQREEALSRLRWAIEHRPLLAGLVPQDPILREFARDVVPADRASAGTMVPVRP